MYAFDIPIMYPFYAFCRKNMKRFVNNEIAPCRVMFYNSKTVCKRSCACNYVHLRFSQRHPPLLWAYNFIQHPPHFLWLLSHYIVGRSCHIFCPLLFQFTPKVVRWILFCFMWGHWNCFFFLACAVILNVLTCKVIHLRMKVKYIKKKAINVHDSSIIMCVIQSGCFLWHVILHTYGLWFMGNLKMAASEQQLATYVLLHAKFEIGGGAMWNFCWYAWKFCCYTAETRWLEHGKLKHSDNC